jgi:hypothetical protein
MAGSFVLKGSGPFICKHYRFGSKIAFKNKCSTGIKAYR